MTHQISPYDHLNGFYRPGLSLPEQLVSTTVGREEVLNLICESLKQGSVEKEKQNFMIMGPPGVGKTHFIRVLGKIVQKENELCGIYTVIQFPEENHRILTFADLLLGIIEILGHYFPDPKWNTLYEKLIEIEDDTELIEATLPELEQYCVSSRKKLLILLENIDVFFRGQLKDSKNIKQFKKFITKSSYATFIGTSQYNLIKSDELRKAPFNLFDIHILEVLDERQTIDLIRKNLEWDKHQEILKHFDDLIPRLKALFEMSGGNPRLSLILYELIAKENKWDIKRQIEKLLDQTTPFFRVRMQSLAPQERALLETVSLAKLEHKSVANVAKMMRQSLQQTSSHLNKLLKAGYLIVTDHPNDKRSKIYRIKEGFFGLWLAIGHSREQNTILPRLVEFLEQWYAEKPGRERKRRQIWHSLNEHDLDTEYITVSNQELLLKYLSDIGDEEEKAQSKLELLIYFLSNHRQKEAASLFEEMQALSYQKPAYFDWMLDQVQNWLKGEIEPVVLQLIEEIVSCWHHINLEDTESLSHSALHVAQNLFLNGYYHLVESFVPDIIRTETDSRSVIVLLERVASSQEKQNKWSDALQTWNRSLMTAKSIGDLNTQGTILNNISQIYQDQGEFDTALGFLQESLDVLKKINDFDGQGTTLNNIATIYFEQGYYEKALECLEQALSVAKTGRNLYIEGITLSNISLIYQARGDVKRALGFLSSALRNMKTLGNRPSECIIYNNISQIYLDHNDIGSSFEAIQSALMIAMEDDYKEGIGLSLYNRGKTFLKAGNKEEALEDLSKAYHIAESMGLKDLQAKLESLAETIGKPRNFFLKPRVNTSIETDALLSEMS